MACYLVFNPKTTDEEKTKIREVVRSSNVDFLEMTMRQLGGITASEIDKEGLKRLTRRAYQRRPAVKQKNQEYASKPETKARRKEYENRESTKKRKKETVKKRAALIKAFREMNPEIYAAIIQGDPNEEGAHNEEHSN